jgi:hypothetical protein
MDNAGEPFALGVAMAMVVVMAALVGTGVWAAVRLEGHMDRPATLDRRRSEHRHGPPAVHRTGTGHLGADHVGTGRVGHGHIGHGHIGTGRNVRCRDRAAHQPAGVR